MKDALAIKQCEANLLAVFAYHGLRPGKILATMTDRILFRRTKTFMDRLENLVPVEFEWWPFNRNHGLTAVAGWRERVAMYSVQLVEHDNGTIEADVDNFNPNHGLGILFTHGLEVLWNKIRKAKTDPFKIAAGLRKRGIDVPDVRLS